MAHAVRHAGEAGAGAVFHAGDEGRIDFAVVLEPEETLAAARRVLFCGMNALAETIAADAPPERPLAFRYPGVVLFDAGRLGALRLAWPEGPEDAPPDWLVLAGEIRRAAVPEAELARDPAAISLAEVGLGDVAPGGVRRAVLPASDGGNRRMAEYRVQGRRPALSPAS